MPALLGERAQPVVGDVTLADVERLESRVRARELAQRHVRDTLASAHVQIAHLPAARRDGNDASVRDSRALRHAQITQTLVELAQISRAEIGHGRTVTDAEFAQTGAVVGHVLDADVSHPDTAAHVQVGQLTAEGSDQLEAGVVQSRTVRHVQSLQVHLLAVRVRLDRRFRCQADTRDVVTTCGTQTAGESGHLQRRVYRRVAVVG